MTEIRKIEPLVSSKEMRLIGEDLGQRAASFIGISYLHKLRESGEVSGSALKKLHEEALGKIPSGDDHDAYVRYHNQAFEYLKENSTGFNIKAE